MHINITNYYRSLNSSILLKFEHKIKIFKLGYRNFGSKKFLLVVYLDVIRGYIFSFVIYDLRISISFHPNVRCSYLSEVRSWFLPNLWHFFIKRNSFLVHCERKFQNINHFSWIDIDMDNIFDYFVLGMFNIYFVLYGTINDYKYTLIILFESNEYQDWILINLNPFLW